MRFLTDAECRLWAATMIKEWDGHEPRLPGESLRYGLPPQAHVYYGLASSVVRWITYRQNALLWVIYSDVWPSSQNLHLYYRLRQSYHDYRLIDEAPGHLFLPHEEEDAVSFLQLAMLNGWEAYFLGTAGYAHAHVSHDGWIEARSESGATLEEIESHFLRMEMQLLPEGSGWSSQFGDAH